MPIGYIVSFLKDIANQQIDMLEFLFWYRNYFSEYQCIEQEKIVHVHDFVKLLDSYFNML